jgi:hypothetical protein
MASKWKFGCLTAALTFFVLSNVHAGPKPAPPQAAQRIQHVLLISIDGMHAVDYANCVRSHTCPTLAQLGAHGVNYTRTSTSRPSDSFPGLMALVTGGTPRTVGAYYDVAYDRVLAPPKVTTGNGLPGEDLGSQYKCKEGQINGTQTEYEEGVEIDQTKLNGGGTFKSSNPLIDGGVASINPDRLERDPFNGCQPVYPWNFVRTNTIYGVIHAAGGYTAWSDKHAVYAVVSGPTGTTSPTNVDDYYSPEVNSNKIPLPGLTTAGTEEIRYDCSKVVMDGNDWTTDFDAIKCYDQLKANAVVNWINGKTHLGDNNAPVPAIFGMNFQAVSVGQKLISPAALPGDRNDQNSGGYEDATGKPRPIMRAEIEFVDAAIGQMVSALRHSGLLDSTAIIITAKYGQSPIDPNRFFPIPGKTSNGNSPGGVIGSFLPAVYADHNNTLGLAEDDISQLWLTDESPENVKAAVDLLEQNGTAPPGVGLEQIYYGASLTTLFNPPGVPEDPGPCCQLREGGDPRTPDIVVIPNVGVVYTGNDKKQSEHGGYAWDDTNVMLLVSNPGLEAKTVHAFVETPQVAPTILQLLGLNPSALDAVQSEGTAVLPDLVFGGGAENSR